MTPKLIHVTKEYLQWAYQYVDGELIVKNVKSKKANRQLGKPAGGKHKSGYTNIKIDGHQYPIHRIIFMYHYGEFDESLEIDHIDKNKQNNRIENLRLVTKSKNCLHRSSDAKGYSWHKKNKHFIVSLTINGTHTYLGCTRTEEEAIAIIAEARLKYREVL